MLRILTVLAVLALVASASSAWVVGEGWVELIDYGLIAEGPEAGNYEYIYDVHNDVDGYNLNMHLYFDASGVVNTFDYYGYDNGLLQSWSSEPVGYPRPFGGMVDPGRWPSYWEDTDGDLIADSWILPTSGPNVEWAMDNIWHAGPDYNITNEFGGIFTPGSGVYDWREGSVDETGVHWANQRYVFNQYWFTPGLMFTFRLVHPMPKGDENLVWELFHNRNGQSYYGTVAGPVPEPATMSLLALGGLAMLRKRRKA